MLHNFSDMMRYLLRKNSRELITIGDEVNYVSNYMSIQKVRMGDRFEYICDIPEKYQNIQCPFLTLQPLVENFFNYVVEPRDIISRISISAFDDGKDVFIELNDNGDGISECKINDIIRGVSRTDNGSIGIYNIVSRSQMLYGEDYKLEITSPNKPMQGTKITLRFPMMNE